MALAVHCLHTIGVRSRVSQALLDNLAVAWSTLDRARPREETGVPALMEALDTWMRWAMRIDEELVDALGPDYTTARRERAGGRPIPGLRHAHELTERGGHPLGQLVTVSAGSPPLFYDAIWKRYEELPSPQDDPGAAQAYREHLASRPARRPAAEVTTFLLTWAVDGPGKRIDHDARSPRLIDR